ncbi:hypothetical protein HDV00_005531 [Rhizophlyctis rosea]|nr:hypothetical protein HDV00_005531 [Rhizophlyctis rosea]
MTKSFSLVSVAVLLPLAAAQSPTQKGQPASAIPTSSVPNATECELKNWNLGGAVDPNAPPKPWPVAGEQVYIADELNFCLNLPNPDNAYLKYFYYSQGKKPSIVEAEGYIQSFCVGNYTTPGGKPMPKGGITAAHVENHLNNPNGKRYIQITGRMDCNVLNINCIGSAPGAYDDGGQFDDVPFNNCGKEPYSGTDSSKHAGLVHYVEQAGDGIFCMRICDGEQQLGDPCNVKNDTAGCFATMGMVDRSGFSYWDAATGFVRNSTPTVENVTATTTTTTQSLTTGTAASSPTSTGTTQGSGSGAGMNAVAGGLALAGSIIAGLFMAM